MPNPVFEPTIIKKHYNNLFCRADDGVKSTVPKLDSGSTANKIADMLVNKENGSYNKSVNERKMSNNSDSFMGDARRLSEAGVRRSSGNSVVLTEDTDKFIIGNRIWVGGTKPGHIAYIGETNFGNGDWAGVVLDEPIGKNDGSVGGTRYFQCEPKKGVFARLTNLTYAPLNSVEDTMIHNSFASVKPLGFSTPMPKRQASTVTSTKTTTKNISQTPVSKNSNDLKLGDRVIVSSSQGSKLGVLKYRGATQFASGEWCGIELDDPLGKNNGTVEGIKYFECEDKFGLFAPVSKVTKSPMSANRMSNNCAIHKVKRSPESMNGSMISAVTSNTMSSIPSRPKNLSDLDRLKLQLTQMKNENELLRSQVTKAANQADVAERKLEETLKAQIVKPSDILTLQNQLDYVKKQLNEEKEKLQNVLFTNEEQNVVNIELKNKNSELLIKIKELEIDLDKERNIAKDVEKETMKIFEKEEELCKIKEELESLKKVIDNNEDELQKSVSNLSSEVVDKDALLDTLRQTLIGNNQIHDRLLKESNEKLHTTTEHLNKIIEEKNKKLELNQEMIDQLNEGIKCLSALKNEEHDVIVNNLKNELSKLKDEYETTIDKKEQDIQISLKNHIQIEDKLKQELKCILENKNQEIEQLLQNYNNLIELNSTANDNNDKLKQELQITTKELQDMKEKKLVYSKEALDIILKQLHSMSINVEDMKTQFDKSIAFKDKQIETCNTTLMQIKEQLVKSKSCLEITFNDKIKEKEDENKILLEKLNKITQNFEQIEKINLSLNQDLKTALKSIQDKTTLIADLERKNNDLESQHNLNRNELEKELSTKLKYVNDELTMLKLEKSTLEEKYDNYVKERVNITIDMDNKLKQNNILLENQIKLLNETTLSKQKEMEFMNKQILELQNEREKLLMHQNLELATKDEIINTLSNKFEQLLTEKQKQDVCNANLQTELTNESTKYEIALKDLQNKIKELELKIEANQEIFNKELKLSSKEKELIKLENINLLEKLKSIEHSKINLEEKLMSSEICKQDFTKLNEVLEEKQKIIDDNQIKMKQCDDLIIQMKNEYAAMFKEKEEEIKKLTNIVKEKIKMDQISLEEKTKAILDEKDKENVILHQKINNLENIKISLEKQLKESQLQENDLRRINKSTEDNIHIIEANKLQIEKLNNSLIFTENEYGMQLLKKENQIKLADVEIEKLNAKIKQIEENNKAVLDEKNKENLYILEKLNILEKTKLNLEEQLEFSRKLEYDIIELKKTIEEKNITIDNNNSNIEQLKKFNMQTKEDFDIKLREKEKEINELVKIREDKLTMENFALETDIKNCLDEKDTEIDLLKKKIQAYEDNNTEKELMLKLETVINKLEKEKNQVSTLEKLKSELEKTILAYESELKTSNMYNKEQCINAECIVKIEDESEKLRVEKSHIQKQFEELKNKCSLLQSALDEKNCEIEYNRTQARKENNSEELDRLKALLEKDHNTQLHLEFRLQELTDENHRLNERIEVDMSNLKNNYNIIQEKNNIAKKYEETLSMLKIKENQILVLQTELNSWKLKDMGSTENNTQEKTDKSAEKNEEIKLLNSIILGLHKKLSAVMETDISEFEIEQNPDGVSREDYRKLYKTSKNNVKLKECENLSLQQEIYKLKTEIDRYSEFKAKCEKLENDKKTLQKLIINYESSSSNYIKNGKDGTKSETEKILEEKDWQINLLNNIIADLHSKVSDYKFSIDALEKQILDSGVDKNKKVRLRTTRLYCEQCEIFDSHDTEDCPDKPESPKIQRKRKVVNDNSNKWTEEPFCVCCDMFGHTANDCDSSLTF